MCPDLVNVKYDFPMDGEFELANERFRNTPAGKAYWEGVAIAAEKIKEKIDRDILDNIYEDALQDEIPLQQTDVFSLHGTKRHAGSP